MNWLFYDYETLSQDPITAPVVCLAMCVVDTDVMLSDEPYLLSTIREESGYVKYNVEEQVDKYNKIIEPRCLDWWKENVDVATRKRLLTPSVEDKSIRNLHTHFSQYVAGRKVDLVFTRGNTFDPIITKVISDYFKNPEPYAWWVIRDTRSFLDGILWGTGIDQKFTPISDVKFNLHDPVDDIALDILRLQTAIRSVSNVE